MYINNKLYAIGDKQLSTRNCFLKSIEDSIPTRICVYDENGYIDKGWGLAECIDKNGKYVFNTSEDVQERFRIFPYPEYPYAIHMKSVWTTFRGWVYESRLEAKYAKFFTLLKIPFIPQPPPLPSYDGKWWRIDFVLWPEDDTKKCFVEIKPGRPFESEELKCESAVHYTKPAPVVLFYGEMCLPFSFDDSGDRPKGCIGIRWRIENDKMVRDTVIWKYDSGDIIIGPRNSTMDYSWNHPILKNAYLESSSISLPGDNFSI